MSVVAEVADPGPERRCTGTGSATPATVQLACSSPEYNGQSQSDFGAGEMTEKLGEHVSDGIGAERLRDVIIHTDR